MAPIDDRPRCRRRGKGISVSLDNVFARHLKLAAATRAAVLAWASRSSVAIRRNTRQFSPPSSCPLAMTPTISAQRNEQDGMRNADGGMRRLPGCALCRTRWVKAAIRNNQSYMPTNQLLNNRGEPRVVASAQRASISTF